ncbi:histone-lysine N-methyltransferase SETMAR [Trichonephila clavipes]|nr:histone-lysine N-methyltransferase SETMAR [Trichonephila clavipes]
MFGILLYAVSCNIYKNKCIMYLKGKCHNLHLNVSLTDLRHATYCFNGTIRNRFLITADEKWVLYDNPKRKRRLSPNEPPRRTAKPGLHPKKALLCIWLGIRGIVHFEVFKPGETVNADLYCEPLDRLNQSLIEKYPAIINTKGVILQHDNARKTLEKINGLGWEVLPYPP